MAIDPLSDSKILDSWATNASAWTSAVRQKKIESRNLVTDKAVVDAVLSLSPRTVLDMGCGEGWLAREFGRSGIDVVGVDAVPALIEVASRDGGDFRLASHEDIAAGKLSVEVDVAVANFSLIGKDAVDGLIRSVPRLLTGGGALVIQTLHPHEANGDEPYMDGWRVGSWAGFSDEFSDPAPWYFRTAETWIALIADSGLRLVAMKEPLHPATLKPASVIFIAKK